MQDNASILANPITLNQLEQTLGEITSSCFGDF